jgi:hypothetical protein
LAPLAQYRQFIVVMLSPIAGKPGKTDKFPFDTVKGEVSNAHNPAIWMDADSAYRIADAWGPSFTVGFVLTPSDPFFCLDIDDAATPQGWSPLAQQLCACLPGTVVEVSQSGRGLHIWGMGPVPEHSKKNVPLHIELYTEARFMALGSSATGAMASSCPEIGPVAAYWFPPKAQGAFVAADGPCAEWRGPTDDDELLRRALKSQSTKSVFGNGASFADLWDANVEVLAKAYPSDNSSTSAYDASSADAALAQHLAFWTGRDVARIERLMRRSALAREKWDLREEYLVEWTITGACGRQVDVLCDKAPEAGPSATVATSVETPQGAAPEQRAVVGTTFLSAQGQVDLFRGCVYVQDTHRVLVPGGQLLNDSRFRARFGGYTFAMDAANERTSRNAWEAFTESQVLRPPVADGTCFRPDLPPAAIVHDAGRSRVNIWWPVDVPNTPGDASPFLRHLALLLPDTRDQTILLSYMAACVQHKGVKFQWAPVIQGVEGNGKTLLSRCVAEALGKRYVHWPKASKITKQFNAWLYGKLFFAVEDIHTPDGFDLIEELKPMITGGDGLEIEAKGVDQTSAEICGNFMFNSNHKSGLRKTRNDRRFAMFFSAQQQAADLIRDGMGGSYMSNLYDWLKSGGYAVVTHLLSTWPIPHEFNPATGCQRAPTTSCTEAAIEQSLGKVEQEIMESIDQGITGFCGGWVSSMALDRMLDRMGKAGGIALSRRRTIMQDLGYDWHPSLKDGRVNNPVMPDGGKPRLYVNKTRTDLLALSSAEVPRAYSKAQGA